MVCFIIFFTSRVSYKPTKKYQNSDNSTRIINVKFLHPV